MLDDRRRSRSCDELPFQVVPEFHFRVGQRYTTERPHSALGYTTPARFATTITAIGTDAPMAHPRQNGASTPETQVVAG